MTQPTPNRPFVVAFSLSVKNGFTGTYDEYVQGRYERYARVTQQCGECPLSGLSRVLAYDEWLAFFTPTEPFSPVQTQPTSIEALRAIILQHAGAAYRAGRTSFSAPDILVRLTYQDLLGLTHEEAKGWSDKRLERMVVDSVRNSELFGLRQQEALDHLETKIAEFWGTGTTSATQND